MNEINDIRARSENLPKDLATAGFGQVYEDVRVLLAEVERLSGRLATTRRENRLLVLALRNVLALAQRMRHREVPGAADHLIRFCAEARILPSVLRGGIEGED